MQKANLFSLPGVCQLKQRWDECNHLMSESFIIKNNSVPFGAIEITKKWSFVIVKEERQSINYFREKEEKRERVRTKPSDPKRIKGSFICMVSTDRFFSLACRVPNQLRK